ncbi:MAG: radical SAM family heme chaperone HemW [Gaiellaceae bacterium]
MSGARHLYVHLPFCAARCGYCDFVTVVGREGRHGEYVDALIAELELERSALSEGLETVFLGGGTPTFTEAGALRRLLRALPDCEELTVEANPETVTPELASILAAEGVTRVSLGAQSFQPQLLETLERRASPDVVRRAFHHLRAAKFDNISLDLIYGIPGQSTIDLDRDIDEALALAPEHLSWYELEAKPGTRFTHAHGDELARQAEEMEDYFERVVARMTGAGYRWYETANFCLASARDGDRDLRSRHNLGYWLGRDYVGLGIGAVSTVGAQRWRNTPRLGVYLEALANGQRPLRELEDLPAELKREERVMLGLRLDEGVPLADTIGVIDAHALDRLVAVDLVQVSPANGAPPALVLTGRGRRLGDGVTAELLA